MGGPPTPPSPILGALRAHLGAPSAFLPPQIPPPKKDKNHIRKHLVPFSPPLNVPPPHFPYFFPPSPPERAAFWGPPPILGHTLDFFQPTLGVHPPPPKIAQNLPFSTQISTQFGLLSPPPPQTLCSSDPPPPPFPSPDLGGRTPKSITLSGVSGRLNPGALGVNEASFPDGLIKTVLINPVGF